MTPRLFEHDLLPRALKKYHIGDTLVLATLVPPDGQTKQCVLLKPRHVFYQISHSSPLKLFQRLNIFTSLSSPITGNGISHQKLLETLDAHLVAFIGNLFEDRSSRYSLNTWYRQHIGTMYSPSPHIATISSYQCTLVNPQHMIFSGTKESLSMPITGRTWEGRAWESLRPSPFSPKNGLHPEAILKNTGTIFCRSRGSFLLTPFPKDSIEGESYSGCFLLTTECVRSRSVFKASNHVRTRYFSLMPSILSSSIAGWASHCSFQYLPRNHSRHPITSYRKISHIRWRRSLHFANPYGTSFQAAVSLLLPTWYAWLGLKSRMN